MPNVDGLTITLGPGKKIHRFYFGAFLILVGLAILSWMTIAPLLHVFAARSWTPTPCTITSSKLEGKSDETGTHLIVIAYEYTVAGQTHQGTRYQFAPAIATIGHAGKLADVSANPPGHHTTCFVNPAAPEQSVFERGATTDLLWGLASLPFVMAGLYIIVWGGPKRVAARFP